MIRLKMIKTYNAFKKGEVVYIAAEDAKLLIKKGYAKQTKDMVETDYRTGHLSYEVKNGHLT